MPVLRVFRLFPISRALLALVIAPFLVAASATTDPTPDVALKPFSGEQANAPGNMEMDIAAIVNDEVISGFDLDQRVRLVVGSSGVHPSPDEMQRIRAQVLRSLIDEKLKMQEAARLKVDVKDKDVVDQLTYLAQRSNMTVDDIKKELKGQGVSIFTLTDQIKADIAWNEIVGGRFGPDVKVSDDEVKRIMDQMKAEEGKPQYDVVEIFLAVDSPDDDAKVKQQAMDLIDQLKKGTPFGQVAQSFSQSSSAANGGDIGWISPGQLPKALDDWIATAHRGEVTLEPIHTLAGYYILGIKETRNVAAGPAGPETPLHLERLSVALSAYADAATSARAMHQLQAVAAKVNGCDTLDKLAATSPGVKVEDLGPHTLASLPPAYQQQVAHLADGTASQTPVRTNEGWDVVVLCGHDQEEAQDPKLPTVDDVKEQLYDQQLSMLGRRYLLELRRDAVIDSRIAEQ